MSSSSAAIVDFESPDIVAIRDTVRELAARHIAPHAAAVDEEEVFFQVAAEAMRDAGLLSLLVPESFGGVGGTIVHEAAIAEELARVDVSAAVIFTGQCFSTEALKQLASPEQQAHYFPRIVEGAILAIALSEPDAGSDAAAMKTTATKVEGGYLLNGTKHYCTNGDIADITVTFASTDRTRGSKGISLFALEKEVAGRTITHREKKMGLHGTTTVEFVLKDCFVPESARLGPENEAFGKLMYAVERGRVAIGAVGVGLSQGALEHAIDHARQRQQFGKPIAAFQGLQFKIADMQMRTEAARQLVHHAARLGAAERSGFQSISGQAKCFATDTAMHVTTDAVQVFGGAGYIRGNAVERMMRDAKILQIFEGTNELMRSLIARHLLGRY